MNHNTDHESLGGEPAQIDGDNRQRIVADATQIRPEPLTPADFVMPVVRGGSRWIGSDLSRENLYDEDGR